MDPKVLDELAEKFAEVVVLPVREVAVLLAGEIDVLAGRVEAVERRQAELSGLLQETERRLALVEERVA